MIQLVSHQIKGHGCNQSLENMFSLSLSFSLHLSTVPGFTSKGSLMSPLSHCVARTAPTSALLTWGHIHGNKCPGQRGPEASSSSSGISGRSEIGQAPCTHSSGDALSEARFLISFLFFGLANGLERLRPSADAAQYSSSRQHSRLQSV